MTEMLPALKAGEFRAFFKAIYGYDPFPWQQMLLEQVAADGWPDALDLPTASGKTAAIDVAVFTLALQADRPTAKRTVGRRVWFVVDRRIVVDDAYGRASKLARRLRTARGGVVKQVADRLRAVAGTNLPLAVARLRGGVPRSVAWAYHPAQPVVITSTVDQFGSRLLFRGYGVGKLARPIHAALAGTDSLVLLDEAHLARPLVQTVAGCRQLAAACATAALPTPFHLTRLSATLSADPNEPVPVVFPKPGEERVRALDNPTLRERFGAAKVAELVVKGKKSDGPAGGAFVGECVKRAADHVGRGRQRVAVMVNRVATAIAVADGLRQQSAESFDVELLTGRMRPVDRDKLIAQWQPVLRADKPNTPAKPVVIVTTQCLEVGADFSFDALVTECASLDALRQRFGRLNRMGLVRDARADILIRSDDAKKPADLKDDKPLDPVYGNAIARTWAWLTARAAGKPPTIDLGVDATAALLADTPTADVPGLLAPSVNAPILLPAYLDLLAQTGPVPSIEPDVSLFLHGPAETRPEAFVVWRADLDKDNDVAWADTIGLMPPLTGEKLSVPLDRLRRWLADPAAFDDPDDSTDVESEPMPVPATDEQPAARAIAKFVRYAGRSDVKVLTDPAAIGPGDVVVVPADRPCPPQLGTLRDKPDVYEQAYRVAHGRQVLRLSTALPPAEVAKAHNLDPTRLADAHAAAIVIAEDRDDVEVLDLLASAGFRCDRRSASTLEYPPDGPVRGLILFGLGRAADRELNPFAFDPDDLLIGVANRRTLDGHTDAVSKRGTAFATKIVGSDLATAVTVAADLHDVGKADPRFQFVLNGGRRTGAGTLLAKSNGRRRKIVPWPLPDDFRHEMLSVQLVEATLADHRHRDLILHLIAAHHGHARPFAPVVIDPDGPPVSVLVNGGSTYDIKAEERRACPPHHLGSGVADRFWMLTRQYGWWGLAALEALLRLADHQASREGEER